MDGNGNVGARERGVVGGAFGRRSFVRLCALLCGGAAALGGCAPAEDAPAESPAPDEGDGDGGSGSAAQAAPVAEAPADPVDELAARVEETLGAMSLEQKVCQLFCVRPESLTGVGQVTAAGDTTRAALAERPVGGIVYFGQNIVDADQFRSLIADTAAMPVPVPLFLAVDEEGGPLVARVANSGAFDVPAFPNMAEIGASGDPVAAYEVGSSIGAYLAELGLNLDFAPVADVLTNPDSAIGARAFSNDPQVVASMVVQAASGLQDRGVSAAAKHFPGHGDAGADSHTGAAVSERTLDELRTCEFVPFKAAVDAGIHLVMVGHISTPNASGDDLPASLSPTAIDGWLRGELGFEGIVVSDAMNMGAVTQLCTPGEAAVSFVRAGGDVVLDPDDFEDAYQGLLGAVQAGELTVDRIDASVRRILRVKLATRG